MYNNRTKMWKYVITDKHLDHTFEVSKQKDFTKYINDIIEKDGSITCVKGYKPITKPVSEGTIRCYLYKLKNNRRCNNVDDRIDLKWSRRFKVVFEEDYKCQKENLEK